ncbi:MAG: arabinose efflux permease family protein [Planctomycetota bacterium]|nr:arabinose efflux permease family protein [Planctomycetota bacterium]
MLPVSAEPEPRIRSRTFAALIENPDYRKFYVGQGVSLVGTWLQDAAVSWIVYEMTRSEWDLGVVSAAGTLPGLLVGLYAGAMADRVPPKKMILGMQVAQMLFAFVLALIVGLGVVQIWQMALVLAMTRVCVAFEMPSRQVFLYDLVGEASLPNAIALNSGLFNASKVLGPALAGVCLVGFGRTACFTLNGLSYLAAIAALMMIRRPHIPVLTPHATGGGLLAGLRHLGHDRHLAALFVSMTFFGVVGMGYSALVPAYARRVVGVGTYGYSVLLASSGLGATLGALALASLGGLRRKDLLVPGGMALFGLSLAAAGGLPPFLIEYGARRAGLLVAVLGMFGAGFGALIFYASTQTQIQTHVPNHLRGRMMGVWMIVFSGSVPLGSLWAGMLANAHGVAAVMLVSAALCLCVGAIAAATGILRRPPIPRRTLGTPHQPRA